MQQIHVTRYETPVAGWAGYIEPEDRSWIVFVAEDGEPLLFPKRDPDGGVIED